MIIDALRPLLVIAAAHRHADFWHPTGCRLSGCGWTPARTRSSPSRGARPGGRAARTAGPAEAARTGTRGRGRAGRLSLP
jgi:hypothetical protein